MTILYYIPQLYLMGGVERTTTAKVNWLVHHGHKVVVFLPEQYGKDTYYELDPRVKLYQAESTPLSESKSIIGKVLEKRKHYRLLHNELSRIIEIERPDIGICTDAEKFPILPSIMGKDRTIVEFHTSREAADLGTPFKEKLMGYNRTTRFIAHKLRLGRGWNRISWHYYGKLVVLSQRDKNYWEEKLKVKNIVAIPNPLSFTNDSPSKCENRIVLSLGRLSGEKNFSELLDIWVSVVKQNSSWRLLIVGSGELESALLTQINRLGLENNVCLSKATPEIIPLYRKASLYVMTSKFEGFPMALLEAQATGLPIVSYNCPCGPSEIVEDGVTGYIVAPGDKETLAKRLLYLMEQDELRIRMGKKAYESSHRYEIDKIMNIWINLFKNISATVKSN